VGKGLLLSLRYSIVGERDIQSNRIDQMDKERFLLLLQQALETIREPRFFKSERGYQGELLATLRAKLPDAGFPGDPIIEQEYQKRMPAHRIKIRPDLIIHIPFDRGGVESRKKGNFVAMELKRRSAKIDEVFESLRKIKEALNYPLTVFINIDSEDPHSESCPSSIAQHTVCFAVRLENGQPVVRRQECGNQD